MYIVVYQGFAGTFDRVNKVIDTFMGERFDMPTLHKIAEEAAKKTAELTKSNALLATSVE